MAKFVKQVRSDAKIIYLAAFSDPSCRMFPLVQDPSDRKACMLLYAYLDELHISDLINTDEISLYDPIQADTNVILDGKALTHMNILESCDKAALSQSLLEALDNCFTPVGKRLLKSWVIHPLRSREQIIQRQDAIAYLLQNPFISEQFRSSASTGVDLERHASRIFSGSSKIKDFANLLDCFSKLEVYPFSATFACIGFSQKAFASLPECPFFWTSLRSLARQFEPDGGDKGALRPRFSRQPRCLAVAFLDLVVPSTGFDLVYDEALSRISQIKQSLEDHRLQEQDKLKYAVRLFLDSSSFATRTLARSHFSWRCRSI